MNQKPVNNPSETRIVSSLVCSSHVEMAINCLGSLARHSDVPVRFQIHEDGTLTQEDSDRLMEMGSVRIVSRAEADDRMATELKGLPFARQLREEMPLALKLFDTVFFHPGPDYAFTDSDVFFVRPFFNPFQLDQTSSHNAVFMDDRENCYCFRSWGLLREPRIQLPARINSGMMVFRKQHYDPEVLNWFLSRPACRSIPGMREQTAWAFLGRRVGCRKFDPVHARIMREGEADQDLIAGHFTARTRHMLPIYVRRSKAENSSSPCSFSLIDAGKCSALDVARFEFTRGFSRVLRS